MRITLVSVGVSCAASLLCLHSPSAGAQVLEEIIVTAQKREESLQASPVAVTVLTGEDLERAGVIDPDALAGIVPNLDVNGEPNRDGLVIVVRGVAGTDVRDSADPTTAFHVDGSYVPRMSGANAYFFDVSRVEVLRGPQGTLYGRNSTSGVINVVTNKPDTAELFGNGQVSLGNFGLLAAQGALNVPISDNLALRFAALRHEHDGYRSNPGIAEDGDDADELAARIHLLWSPTDDTSLLATLERYERQGVGQTLAAARIPGGGFANQDLLAPDPADTNPLGTQGFRDNDDDNFRLELNHSFGGFDLFYLAAFRSHHRDFLSDTRGAGFTFDNRLFTDNFLREVTTSESWTHEIRLTSTHEGRLQWIAGTFYLDEEIDSDFDVQLVRDPLLNVGRPGSTPNGNDRISVRFIYPDQSNESVAAFFNASYDLSDALRLNAGVRWTEDDKNSGGAFGDVTKSRQIVRVRDVVLGWLTPPVFPAVQVADESWSEVTWKLGLDWQVSDDLFTYVTLGTGYKSGGYNRGSQGLTTNGSLQSFEPETITSLELGAKWDLLDGRARLNLAGFVYDYEDLQVAAIRTAPDGTRVNTTFIATTADVVGVEAEGQLLFGDTGSAFLSLGLLDTELGSLVVPDDLQNAAPVDVSGNELPRAPTFNVTVGVVPKAFRAFNGTLTPRLQIQYEADAWFSTLNRPIERRDSYTKTDLTLTYEREGSGWYAEAFIFNVEDDDVLNDSLCGEIVSSGSAAPDAVLGCVSSFQAPRTYGIRVGFRR